MLTGQRPWGWRDGTVAGVDGLWIEVDYLEGRTVRLWHHRPIGAGAGEPVRVHEGSLLLDLPGQGAWLSIRTDGGLGAVPCPEDADLWAAENVRAIVSLETGRAIPVRPPLGGEG